MLLIEKWAWGLMTLPTVQSVAAAAVKDQAQGEDLQDWSKRGIARPFAQGHGQIVETAWQSIESVSKALEIMVAEWPGSLLDYHLHHHAS